MANLKTAPVAKPVVTYFPSDSLMYVENGKLCGEGETIARSVVLFRDRKDEQEVVSVCFESSVKTILEPLLNAVLAEYGLGPMELPSYKSPVPLSGYSEPEAVVTYEPVGGYVQVENGRPLGKQTTVAEGVVVFFDAEKPQEGVGLRIGPDAKTILNPLVEAVLEEHGVGSGSAP